MPAGCPSVPARPPVWVRLVLVVGTGGCRGALCPQEGGGSNSPKLDPTPSTPFSLFFNSL